jgi:hypothetical protein
MPLPVCAPKLGAECSQFAEFKRMEREHQKEKQKLLKDKDAGALMHLTRFHSHLDVHQSEKSTHEGQSNKDQDGEPCTGVTKGAPCYTHEINDMNRGFAQENKRLRVSECYGRYAIV